MSEVRDAKLNSVPRGFDRLTPLEEARTALLEHCRLAAITAIPIDDAIGHVAGDPISAPLPMPNESIALRDGYAVNSLETQGASAYAPAFALSPPQWVSCGDRLPQSADAILPAHAVQETTQPVEILAQAAPGDGVRWQGGDVKAGFVVVEAGETIRPVHLGLLRACGIDMIGLRLPRVAILVRRDLQHGDSIGPAFSALAKASGALADIKAVDMNDADLFGQVLAASDADLIISIGGTGFGDCDSAAAALQKAGTLLAHGLALRPGETAGLGIISKPSALLPVILAPGRLEAALAVWLSLVKPCLAKMTGIAPVQSGETFPLARKIVSNPGVADIVLLRRAMIDDKMFWEPIATGDLPWHALARAAAFHVVAPESEGYAAGASLYAEEI